MTSVKPRGNSTLLGIRFSFSFGSAPSLGTYVGINLSRVVKEEAWAERGNVLQVWWPGFGVALLANVAKKQRTFVSTFVVRHPAYLLRCGFGLRPFRQLFFFVFPVNVIPQPERPRTKVPRKRCVLILVRIKAAVTVCCSCGVPFLSLITAFICS